MGRIAQRRFFGMAGVLAFALGAQAQVFTVGEKTATAGINTDFKPTNVELPDHPMTERGRRELMRDLEAEQGFAHRVLPVGTILTLQANGNMTPKDEAYKQVIYKKGQAASPGDRVVITAMVVKGDRIVIDLNGGPYVAHRFLRHVQVGVGGATSAPPDLLDQATGCRVNLVFEGGTPEVSAPEVKALLEPIVDFGAKTSEVAYAETLPTPVKAAIESHEVLVGMNHRMVLAAMGEPEHKLREGTGDNKYEEWIYGHQPQTVTFVRFEGDRVSQIKVAALGKPIEVHSADELDGYLPPKPTREIALGDADDTTKQKAGPPTLQLPGEKLPTEGDGAAENHKVQFPDEKPKPIPPPPSDDANTGPAPPPDAGPSPVAPVPPALPGNPKIPPPV
jgi:hypothetical protein